MPKRNLLINFDFWSEVFFWYVIGRGQKKFHLKEATENSITKLPKRSTETSDSYFLYASSMGQFRKILPFDHFLPPK